MIQYFKRVGVQVQKITWHLHGDKLAHTFAIVQITAHEAFQQQHAHGQGFASLHDSLARIYRPYLENGFFQNSAFLNFQFDAATIPKKFVRKQYRPFIAKRLGFEL
ncbi:hypothetical protein EBBID32_25990 [Sphingobium indicum BiD32]|uniref:Uncharacterized protein n=1 Tax=Sphingobium indicum BiD32 TaxID=1301087 RepID=N1MS76_9SPHN|nr:hypothetical protein EBBID32_25990 [Sphingobium indicum BiD32]